MIKVFLAISRMVEIPLEVAKAVELSATHKDAKKSYTLAVWSEDDWYAMQHESMWEIHEFVDSLLFGEYQYLNLIEDDSFELKGSGGFLGVKVEVTPND